MKDLLNLFSVLSEGDDGAGSNASGGTPPASTPPTDPPKGETYTKEEMTKIIEREKKDAYKAAQKQLAEEAKKKDMSDAERLKVEKEEAEKAKADAEAKLADARLEAKLAGKVSDPEYALFKIKASGDKYLNKDGSPDIESFLKDFPNQATTQPKRGPVPTKAGGGNISSATMNDLIRKKAGK